MKLKIIALILFTISQSSYCAKTRRQMRQPQKKVSIVEVNKNTNRIEPTTHIHYKTESLILKIDSRINNRNLDNKYDRKNKLGQILVFWIIQEIYKFLIESNDLSLKKVTLKSEFILDIYSKTFFQNAIDKITQRGIEVCIDAEGSLLTYLAK